MSLSNKHNDLPSPWIHKAKALWGAQSFPFTELPIADAYPCENQQHILNKTEQMLSLGCSGVLTGANGTGKSHLLKQLSNQLQAAGNHVIFISHTTIRPNALIRTLCRELGIKARHRKEDNVTQIHEHCIAEQPTQTLLLIDEAGNLQQETLEELRLLKCHISSNKDQEYSLPILLCGDENLFHRLCMRYFKPLLSRLNFTKELTPLSSSQTNQYINHHLQKANIYKTIFDAQASDTIYHASGGNPRTINSLCLQSLGMACEQNHDTITSQLINQVIEEIPWLNLLQN